LLLSFVLVILGCKPDIDRSGETIFKKNINQNDSLSVMIDSIRILQETNYSLLLNVYYTYNDTIPTDQIKLFVLPDMPYWSSNNAKVSNGQNNVTLTIGLYDTKMKEDKVSKYESSRLNVSFDRYLPDSFAGSIHQEAIPFKKLWKTRD